MSGLRKCIPEMELLLLHIQVYYIKFIWIMK